MKKNFKNLIFFTQFVLNKTPSAFTKLMVILFVNSGLAVGASYIISLLANDLAQMDVGLYAVLPLLLLVIGVRVFSQIASMIYQYLSNLASESASYELQKKFISDIKDLQYVSFDNPVILDRIARIKNIFKDEADKVLKIATGMAYSLIMVAIYSLILASIRWYLPIIMIIGSFVPVIINMKHGMGQYINEVLQSRWFRQTQYYEDLLVKKQNIKEIRLFNLHEHIFKQWAELRKAAYREDMKILTKHSIAEFIGKFIQNFGSFICLLVVGWQVVTGYANIGQFFFLITVSSMFMDDVTAAIQNVNMLGRFYAFVDDIKEISIITNKSAYTKYINEIKANEKCLFRFENVSFSYPESDKKAIDNINCYVEPGESVVCVGDNGSGKTTFINLLLGVLVPTEGNVTINEVDVSTAQNSIAKRVAYMPQQFIKYQMSVRDNIYFGRKQGNINILHNEKDLLAFVDDLPCGFDTKLGQLHEKTVDLSGGEWQRIAIARTLFKENTDILIFDEFTSALDPIIESSLYEFMKNIIAEKTTIIVSHRLAVCKLADRIMVFSEGKIVENGSHEALMKAGGKYYDMFSSQSMLYSKGA